MGVHTELERVLLGPVGTPTQEQSQTTLVMHALHVESPFSDEARALDGCLRSFWELESFGITGQDCSVTNKF